MTGGGGTYGRMGVWAYGRMGVWAYGRMGVWAYGRMGVWACRRCRSKMNVSTAAPQNADTPIHHTPKRRHADTFS
jgi:hypothetical protein